MKLSRQNFHFLAWLIAALCLLASAQSAHAHIDSGGVSGFKGGFIHPWSGLDHIIAMLAVGIWGAQLGKPAIWLLPVTFPLVMAMGGFFGLIGLSVPGGEHTVEVGVALSGVVLGIMILGALRPPLVVAAILVGIFGLFHGYAHGSELPKTENMMTVAIMFSIGFVISTGTLHALGITIGLVHPWPAGRIALRSAGAVIVLLGCWCVWSALFPAAEALK